MSKDPHDPWGAHTSTYDRVYSPLTSHIARSLVAAVDARIMPGSKVLDIACGSGALLAPALERAQRLRREGSNDYVVGTARAR